MTIYLTSYTIEAFVSSAWSDRTADVVGNIDGDWGITGNSAIDRLADTGTLTFVLKNQSDLYIPGHASVFDSGWDKNAPIRLQVTYDGLTKTRFRGYVANLEIMSEAFNRKFIRVTCVDWMDYAARSPVVTAVIGINQTADQGITTLVSGMKVAPQETDYATGTETFPTIFDDVSSASRVASEFSKIIDSEIGYMYVKKSANTGEKLVFEDRLFRSGVDPLHQYPVLTASADDLLLETGDKILLESSGSLLLDQGTDAVFSNIMIRATIEYGKDVINHFRATVFPKGRDSSNVVLFNLENPILLTPGQSFTFRTNYTDPAAGGGEVRAVSDTMVTPVATTDYLMNTQEDGGGSDTTSNLSVTAVYGTEGVTYTLLNSDADIGYVTFLQARGIGIYKYNPIQTISENAASITSHGYQKQVLRQEYKQVLTEGTLFGDSVVYAERNPRTDLESINLAANSGSARMFAFINADVGQLIHVVETDSEIDNYYHIQRVSFQIALGGIIMFKLFLREVRTLAKGFTALALEFDSDSEDGDGNDGDAVNFGYMPHLVDQTKRTWSMWIKPFTSFTGVPSLRILSIWADNGASAVAITEDEQIIYGQKFSGPQGFWETNTSTITLNVWNHVMVTKDSTTPTEDPKIYINGVDMAITETITPSGTVNTEIGANLVIGNYKTATVDYEATFDGQIFDCRLYHEIKVVADAVTLYNSGNPDASLLTSGLEFQAMVVKSEDAAGHTGVAFTETEKVFDNIYGFVGSINNGPIGRAAP